MLRVILLVIILFLNGCAAVTKQTVKPFESDVSEVCIIENPKVRESFLQVYRDALTQKGYVVKMLNEHSDISDCSVTTTYLARWRWDLALYMSYVSIEVYKNGEKSGDASYKIVKEGATGKFIDAEEKIKELVDQLFPKQ